MAEPDNRTPPLLHEDEVEPRRPPLPPVAQDGDAGNGPTSVHPDTGWRAIDTAKP